MNFIESLEPRALLSGGVATGSAYTAALRAESHAPAAHVPAISASTDLGNSVTGAASDGSLSIPYRFFVPHLTSAKQKVPLILYLHGLGDVGTDDVAQTYWMGNLQATAAHGTYAAYVLAPQIQAPGVWAVEGSQSTEAESVTMALIRDVLKHTPNIDSKRIYVTGVSAGSQGVWDLLQRNPKFFAAGVPMSAGINPAVAPKLKGIPIWAFHGSADMEVPPSSTRVMIDALVAIGGTPRYTEVPGGGHEIWNDVYAMPSLYQWLFAQHLRKTPK